MNLTNTHLMILRSLKAHGWEAVLKGYLISRVGGTEADLAELVRTKLVRERKGRLELTPAGKSEYNRQRKGRYF